MNAFLNAYGILMGKFFGKWPLWRTWWNWEDNIKMYLRKMACENVNWNELMYMRNIESYGYNW